MRDSYLFPIAYTTSKRGVKPFQFINDWVQELDEQGNVKHLPMTKEEQDHFDSMISWWNDKIKSIKRSQNEDRSGSFHSVSVSC
jgi:hypothetical protein